MSYLRLSLGFGQKPEKMYGKLAKKPEVVVVGANKGFDETSGELPNVNDVVTPAKVKNSKTHQLSVVKIMNEIPIK